MNADVTLAEWSVKCETPYNGIVLKYFWKYNEVFIALQSPIHSVSMDIPPVTTYIGWILLAIEFVFALNENDNEMHSALPLAAPD